MRAWFSILGTCEDHLRRFLNVLMCRPHPQDWDALVWGGAEVMSIFQSSPGDCGVQLGLGPVLGPG